MRSSLLIVLAIVGGCGPTTPPSDMPLRTWQHYAANPSEIEPMLEICQQWAASQVPVAETPAVVASNCSAAAFAKHRTNWRR
jgi:hypothetical protein